MTSKQHAAWTRRGSPRRTARPLAMQRDRLRAYGYTVYDLGNTDHLDHQPPEHHCPYSEANWPTNVGKPMPDVITAIDIMSPARGSGLPSLQLLGAQFYADKEAGIAPWIVDMNWGPDNDRTAVRDTWRPGHHRETSTDVGHIHQSCRSDMIDSTAADLYDPVARIRNHALISAPTFAFPGDDMLSLIKWNNSAAVFLTNGITARLLGPTGVSGALSLHNLGVLPLTQPRVIEVGDKTVIGLIVGQCPVEFTELAMPGSSVIKP